jgi:hypothetical protein
LLLRIFVVLIAALPFLAVAAIAMSLQNQPLVAGSAILTAQDIERAKRIVDAQDLRKEGRGGTQTVSIDERDLNVALAYLADRFGRAAARVVLQSGTALLQASVELPQNPIGRYVNIDAAFREAEAAPHFDRLRIGSLPVPRIIADALLREGLRRLTAVRQGQLAASVVKSVRFRDGVLAVTYQWSDEVAALARVALIAPEEHARLRAYQERLADVVEKAPRTISLARLLPPLFQLALDRGAGGDPVRDNRAAITVLALFVTGKALDRIVPAAAAVSRSKTSGRIAPARASAKPPPTRPGGRRNWRRSSHRASRNPTSCPTCRICPNSCRRRNSTGAMAGSRAPATSE